MAGLLDNPEALAGIAAGAALMQGKPIGGGLLDAVQAYTGILGAADQRELKKLYTQSQIEENRSQQALREAQIQQLSRRNSLIGGLLGGGAPSVAGQAMSAPQGSGGGAGGSFGGIPPQLQQAVAYDLAFGDGKGVANLIKPDVTVANGYAFDKNRIGQGFLPQLNISANGQATQVQVGPNGQPIVSLPQGAAQAYSTLKGIDAGIQTATTLKDVYDPSSGRMVQLPVSQILDAANGRGQPAGYANESQMRGQMQTGQDVQSNIRELAAAQRDLSNPTLDANSKAMLQQHVNALQQRISQFPQSVQGGPMASGPSASDVARNEAEKTRLVNTAAADVVRDTAQREKVRGAGESVNAAERALTLLNAGPTSSGIGRAADSAAAYFGRSLPGADVAAQLKVVAADLVKNVPRFEGPQSDRDVEQYKAAAGNVANEELPVGTRKAAAQEVLRLQQKAAGGGSPQQRQVTRTGTINGRKVNQYSDGSIDYAD